MLRINEVAVIVRKEMKRVDSKDRMAAENELWCSRTEISGEGLSE